MKLRLAAVLAAVAVALGMAVGPAAAAPTGGSGGALTNRLNQSFTSGGITSTYHVFASGLDWSKQVGLLMYADGSGGYGIDNPTQTYLLDSDGTDGAVAMAKKHNLLLVTPEAPAPDCPSDNCWFNSTGTPTPAQKAAWTSALMTHIKGQYNIENDRIAIGGYSSGAQWVTRYFLPAHGEAQSVDLAVAISYGGAPASTPSFSAGYKAATTVSFDTGTSDPAYTAAGGSREGYDWYTNAGFDTDATWPSGVGHARDGQFDTILDREITQHLKPAGTTTPSYVAWSHTIAPTRTGAQLTVDIPAGVTTTFRVSANPITTQTGFYDTTTVTGDDVKDLALVTSLSPGTSYYYTIETAGRVVQKSGTFKTLP